VTTYFALPTAPAALLRRAWNQFRALRSAFGELVQALRIPAASGRRNVIVAIGIDIIEWVVSDVGIEIQFCGFSGLAYISGLSALVHLPCAAE
jgi:hypothetical protein